MFLFIWQIPHKSYKCSHASTASRTILNVTLASILRQRHSLNVSSQVQVFNRHLPIYNSSHLMVLFRSSAHLTFETPFFIPNHGHIDDNIVNRICLAIITAKHGLTLSPDIYKNYPLI